MTTTADFYDETGPLARWLGSLQGNADPQSLRRVACGRLGHGYHPRNGWPCRGWTATDWVFTFAHGRVWITTGSAWRPATPPGRGLGNDGEAGWRRTR